MKQLVAWRSCPKLYLQLYIALPNRAGNDFVVHLITLAHVQDPLLAQVNRTALMMALETQGSEGYLMAASNQIFLVMDAGTPVAAFTARPELKAYLRRRLDAFINPLVYTSWGNQGTPSIMTMSAALAE